MKPSYPTPPRDGYLPLNHKDLRGGIWRRLMIGSDGPPDSGKSEFALSAPGPIKWLCLDRGLDGLIDNPNPPTTRNSQVRAKVVQVPKATQMAQPGYVEYWREFYSEYKQALDDEQIRCLVLDGDSDSWELQRLAEFGRLSKVPSNLYDNVNAARRAMYARAWDSGKIMIATNRIRKVYATEYDALGKPKMNNSGNEVRSWTGEFERQGFSDQEYLWHIQLRHMHRDTKAGPEWGIKIMKCKVDISLVGLELWGDDCNFTSLVTAVYPDVPLREWGF